MLPRVYFVQQDFLDFDRETSSLWHGISRIDHEVRQNLIELTGINEDTRSRVELSFYRDTCAQKSAHYGAKALDTFAQLDQLGMAEFSLSNIPQLSDEVACATKHTLNRSDVISN